MYIQMIENLELRYFILPGPGEKPKLIEGLPASARIRALNPNKDKHELIYAMDMEGNENWQFYRFDIDTEESTLITNGKDKHYAISYNPSGDKIIYTSNRRQLDYFDHYMMDPMILHSEELIRENDGKFYFLDSWSPDGKQIVVRKFVTSTEKQPYLLDIENGELTLLSQDSLSNADYYGFEWTSDGSTLFYPSSYNSEFKKLHERSLVSEEDSVITQNIPWDTKYVTSSPDNKWVVFTVNEDGSDKLYIYNRVKGITSKFDKLPVGNIPYASFYPLEDCTIGFNFIKPSGAMDIYSYNLESEKLIAWLTTDGDANYSDPQTIHYPTFDMDSLTGKTRKITTYYHQPNHEFQKPYPVIINIHGGPESQWGPMRDEEDILDLNRGFAVLKPNVRGSTGYGNTFTDLDNGMLRENSVKDIGELLDWITKQPDLDSKNIFVRGGSYGGYMSLASAMYYSDRIAGVIDMVGISNFVTMMENENKVDRSYEYGDINNPKMRAFLDSISPSNNVNKIKVPVMIIQGKNDPRVPVEQSRLMIDKLKENGNVVWYMEASNEGHNTENLWNSIYTKSAEFEFIDGLME
ncbi:S9 family peptidase [Gaetbulibacter aestuarii]